MQFKGRADKPPSDLDWHPSGYLEPHQSWTGHGGEPIHRLTTLYEGAWPGDSTANQMPPCILVVWTDPKGLVSKTWPLVDFSPGLCGAMKQSTLGHEERTGARDAHWPLVTFAWPPSWSNVCLSQLFHFSHTLTIHRHQNAAPPFVSTYSQPHYSQWPEGRGRPLIRGRTLG